MHDVAQSATDRPIATLRRMSASSPHARWLEYFENRQSRDLEAPYDAPFRERPGRAEVAASLARFELGESGEGERIRRLAAETGDPAYARAIDLFVAEEGQHARWLGVLRKRFGGEKLTSHWSDGVFVALRHVGGLRREICVLLTAEVIALTYYRVLAQAYEDPVLAAACERILIDERGHVAFHRATLGIEFASMPPAGRTAAVLAWRAFVAATAKVVALDHRAVLALAGVSRREFEAEVRDRAARLAHAVRQGPAGERPGFAPL